MTQRTTPPASGHALPVEPHYRLTEPLENNLDDARALLGLLADLALMAADGQRFSLTGNEFAGVMNIILGLLPDSRQMDYVPSKHQEVLQ